MVRPLASSLGASWVLSALFLATVLGCALREATRIEYSALYTEEARAALHVKIRVQPWWAERPYVKLAGSVLAASLADLRWMVHAKVGCSHAFSMGDAARGTVMSRGVPPILHDGLPRT